MKTSFLHPVLGTLSSRYAKKTVVRMTELVAAFLTISGTLSFLASLIHLVALFGSLSIIDTSTQFITWFSFS